MSQHHPLELLGEVSSETKNYVGCLKTTRGAICNGPKYNEIVSNYTTESYKRNMYPPPIVGMATTSDNVIWSPSVSYWWSIDFLGKDTYSVLVYGNGPEYWDSLYTVSCSRTHCRGLGTYLVCSPCLIL